MITAAILHRHPRGFRWRAERDPDKRSDRAILRLDGQIVGSVIRYAGRRAWSAYTATRGDQTRLAWQWDHYARRCDAKRAVECAVVGCP